MRNNSTFTKHTNPGFSRRRLIAGALAGIGAAAVRPGWLKAAEANQSMRRSGATAIVTLGKTGIKTSRLAQGTGYNGTGRSSEHTRLGMKAFTKLIRHSLDHAWPPGGAHAQCRRSNGAIDQLSSTVSSGSVDL